jgi:signal transduction histidine kinase
MIVNAAHAITDVVGDGGKGKGKIRVKTRADGDWAVVEISDSGSGMPAHVQQRIFEPFFTTKEVGKGTGQGLAIAHNVIVDKHGGTIKVTSSPGAGTTFTIRLPIGGVKTESDAAAAGAAA